MNHAPLRVSSAELAAFCQRWQVRALSLFGSALRDDFGPTSDVDLLVEFEPRAAWSLWDHIRMQQELEALFGRKVDLITKRALERGENWLLRQVILDAAQPLFPASGEPHAPGSSHAA
ncbi:MAG: nucleotidyltransferase family protein [Chloroflexi bacterium]|nr:nucleotidyltransferase family protein [Chloroflexota bacterium]